ncbi:MAG: molybdenum ABC transporter ATP-binding protein [Opitutales bacterium]|nr:molybdenum ABC transporter ATP-binding protein [Opitutales bacterium]
MSENGLLFDIDLRLPLDRFELNVEYTGSARTLGVFGVSGSGKTTLIECFAGLRKGIEGRLSFSGESWVDSEERAFLSADKRRIGYVPQDHWLFPHRSVRGNLEMGKRRALEVGVDFETTLGRVVEVLELKDTLDRGVDRLSGGERQRVALGRALCSGPQLLLLDEPLASLDRALRRRILQYLVRVRDAFDIPMVIVSHNPMELQVLCDEALVLDEGRIVERGEPEELFRRKTIFDTAKDQGFENVFSGTLLENGNRTTTLGLKHENQPIKLRVPKVHGVVGDRVIASLASDDILIAIEKPIGLSARNCIPARIEGIEETEMRQFAIASIDDAIPQFVVELTQDAIDELSLKSGMDVFLVFKTSAVRV